MSGFFFSQIVIAQKQKYPEGLNSSGVFFVHRTLYLVQFLSFFLRHPRSLVFVQIDFSHSD
jgi:hypothetical protein